MPELLLEVGCEELPASFVENAYTDLANRLVEALGELYQTTFQAVSLGTPRRLIVSVQDLPETQPDAVKELRGPGIKAAYDEAGNPSNALLGFCRSQGLDVNQLRRDDQYVWATKVIPGLPTCELLATVIPASIRKLTFEKSMRWGPLGAKFRFARPIRWILAAYNGGVVSFELEGVESGLHSVGHRFYSPEKFSAHTLEDLLAGLRQRSVEPDKNARREIMLEAVQGITLNAELPEALVDENVFLTEWPTPIQGEFRHEFLELPEPVLTTAMAKHEKMFPIRDGDRKLTNQFIFIRNSGEDATVRRGAEWVLNARLADADFFFREDKKSKMDDFLAKTSGIVFQAQLGTVRQRADRLAKLAAEIATRLGANPNLAAKAALYAKADLSTGLVAEFNSLQGIVGADYSAREGFEPEVRNAISNQYRQFPLEKPDSYSVALIVADSVDKLAGYLGIGLVPSGSADPYGLRRAATNLINSQLDGDFSELFAKATEHYLEQGHELTNKEALTALTDLFISRYEAIFAEFRYDVVQAAVNGGSATTGTLNPSAVRQRLDALTTLVADSGLVQTTLRPLNIFKSFPSLPEAFEYRPNLDSSTGEALFDLLKSTESQPPSERLKSLVPAIHAFFEATMIMDKDETTRSARQLLVKDVRDVILTVGDFTKIVIEGV
jgi:glycyl-tRNA synthetase beta chain